ncbi:bacillithiol system protein YtxJ [Pricia antarctica]|uniref:Bacillithiol system protein YtxJ n=1 Tax=Pricia antarctica TaxID=641691 RepID=A0A1G7BGH1_9FLAO|nr:bacillithiol system redox-active protein YtxJ [Pricia antarctica]SDE25325.1 bacillithiol system protein YtxJ [Pricia antarctica]
MSLFDSIFGSKNSNGKKNEEKLPWISLTSLEQLEEIEQKSASRPQVIFKHSTTCGVSRMVLNLFEKNPMLQEGRLDIYFLDLHRHREISNEIAQKFQIMHQSPQLLVIKNGQIVAHGSHGGITEIDLDAYV